MPPSCSVPTCKFLDNNSYKLSYHEIPSKEPIRTVWLHQIGKHMGLTDWEPSSETAVVCSKHFIEADFVETPQRRRLKPNAVPSVFCQMEGRPYFVPRRRRKKKIKSSTNPIPFTNIKNDLVSSEPNQVSRDMLENNGLFGNSKFDAFLQANYEKAFFEMLQGHLEMMDVANHFLADYSALE